MTTWITTDARGTGGNGGFQRGHESNGIRAEMMKNYWKRPKKVFDSCLGPRGRWFETSHSDQVMVIQATLSVWIMWLGFSLLRISLRRTNGGLINSYDRAFTVWFDTENVNFLQQLMGGRFIKYFTVEEKYSIIYKSLADYEMEVIL